MNGRSRVNRVLPKLPPHLMQTYAMRSPRSTHRRPATCAEVECPATVNGWKTTVDERTDLGQGQAYFIREQSGRQFTEERTPVGMTVFTFPAGQACFRAGTHTAPMDRPPIFVVRGGDWRGNPQRRSRVHTRPELWVEDCAENLDKVTERIKRG